MKKKFSKEAVYNEWLKYRKWYDKQEAKGMALSGRSAIIASSFEEYMFYRDNVSEGFTKSNDVLGEMKRLSYNTSTRQLEHLAGEIETFLETGDEAQIEQFLTHFNSELPQTKDGKIDKERLVYDTLHGNIIPLESRTGKHHGWYGVLADMMAYIETIGGRVNWNS